MKIIARNKKALHDYEVLERVEAGIELRGAEVKAIRAGNMSLSDSYAQCLEGELYLNHLHISPYDHAGAVRPEPLRKRKLLLHRKQIARLCSEVERKKLTLIPLSAYFLKQWVKIEIGLCRGRKRYDKREAAAAADAKRRIAAVMKQMRYSGSGKA